MKNLFYLCILFFSGIIVSCSSDTGPDDDTSAYTDADAVYITMKKEYTLNEDGSMDYNYSHRLKLLTFASFNRMYGETFISYNPEYQDLKINHSMTTMSDGKVVEAPDNAFNEMLPYYAADAPAYNHLRQMVVTHTALERNAVIELDYLIHSKRDFMPALMGDEKILSSSPVKEMKIVVNIPESKELYYVIINDSLEPSVETGDNMKTYTWVFENVAADTYEDHIPENLIHQPRLIFSTAEQIDPLVQNIGKQEEFSSELSENMKKEVADIIADKKDKYEIALALQDLVVNDLKLYHIQSKETGYRVRTAEQVWNSNGGTALEKGVLFTALLKEAGITSDVVAVIPKQLYTRKAGSLLNIESFMVRIQPEENKDVYLSVAHTDKYNKLFDLDEKIVVPLSGRTNNKPVMAGDKYHSKIDLSGELSIIDEKSITGEIAGSFTRTFNPYFHLKKDDSNAKGLIANAGIKDVKIESLEQGASEIIYSIDLKDPFKDYADYLYWDLPKAREGSDSWGIGVLPDKRKDFFEVPVLINEKYEYNIALPDNIRLVTPEISVEEKNSAGSVFIELTQTEQGFNIVRKLIITKQRFCPEEYEGFRKMIEIWNNKKYRQLVLKKV